MRHSVTYPRPAPHGTVRDGTETDMTPKQQRRKAYYEANKERERTTKRRWRHGINQKLDELAELRKLGNLPDPGRTVGPAGTLVPRPPDPAPVYYCPHCGANLGVIAI